MLFVFKLQIFANIKLHLLKAKQSNLEEGLIILCHQQIKSIANISFSIFTNKWGTTVILKHCI